MNFRKFLFVLCMYCLASGIPSLNANAEEFMKSPIHQPCCTMNRASGFNSWLVSLVGGIVLAKIGRVIGILHEEYPSMGYLYASPAPPSPALQ